MGFFLPEIKDWQPVKLDLEVSPEHMSIYLRHCLSVLKRVNKRSVGRGVNHIADTTSHCHVEMSLEYTGKVSYGLS